MSDLTTQGGARPNVPDVTTALRAYMPHGYTIQPFLVLEAADEIDRLRAALATAQAERDEARAVLRDCNESHDRLKAERDSLRNKLTAMTAARNIEEDRANEADGQLAVLNAEMVALHTQLGAEDEETVLDAVLRLQRSHEDDTVLLGTVAAERDAALQRAEAAAGIALAVTNALRDVGAVTFPLVDCPLDTAVRTLARRAEQAEAALAQVQAEREWKPIETAPRDGREVILAVALRAGIPHGVLVGHCMPGGHCIEDHPAIDGGWYFWNGCMFDKAANPTHWMEMPCHPLASAWQKARQQRDAQPPALPPLPEHWRHMGGPFGEFAGLITYRHVDTRVSVWPSGRVSVHDSSPMASADLITVLRHAERAHQELKGGSK